MMDDCYMTEGEVGDPLKKKSKQGILMDKKKMSEKSKLVG